MFSIGNPETKFGRELKVNTRRTGKAARRRRAWTSKTSPNYKRIIENVSSVHVRLFAFVFARIRIQIVIVIVFSFLMDKNDLWFFMTTVQCKRHIVQPTSFTRKNTHTHTCMHTSFVTQTFGHFDDL